MTQIQGIDIVGTGHYVPEKIVTNDDLSRIVDTNDEWITTRTGIRERHFSVHEDNCEIAAKASKMAIENAGIKVEEIGICIVATFTSDCKFPSVACMVQKEIGLRETTACFDVNAACSGFIYGLQIVQGMLIATKCKYALLIGSEIISRYLDMEDRSTCILFGDGAGAAIIKLSSDKGLPKKTFIKLGSAGDKEMLYCDNVRSSDQFIHMEGNQVFKFAVKKIPQCINEILKEAKISMEEIDYIVCHQANMRIIEYVAKVMKQPKSKFYVNVDRYGNTSAASIPIALSEMNIQKKLERGMKIVCVGFGAGLTWGCALIEW